MNNVLNLRRKIKKKEIAPKVTRKKSLSRGIISSDANLPSKNISTAYAPPAKPPLISWEAPSFHFNPQKRYLSLIIIALLTSGGGALLFFKGDMLTAIFLLLSSLILILYSTKRPEISKITIDQRGVAIGDSIHYYRDLKSFWIHYNPNSLKELSLESKKWYMPYVKVSIENNNPLLVRSLLINFLAEKEHEQSLVDIVARKIGL